MFQLPTTTGGIITDLAGTKVAGRVFGHAPASANKKIGLLDELYAAKPSLHSHTSELAAELQDDKAALANLIQSSGGNPDPTALAEAEAKVAISQGALDRGSSSSTALTAMRASLEVTRRDALGLLNQTKSSGKRLVEVPASVPKGKDDASLTADWGDLGVEMRTVEAAPNPEEPTVERGRSMVEAEARHGAPRAWLDLEHIGNPLRPTERTVLNLHWPTKTLPAQPLHGSESIDVFDGLAAFCWFAKDAIMAKVEADIRAFFKGYKGPTYTEPQRRQRLTELRAGRLLVERQLAQAIWERIEAGDDSAVFPEGLSPEAVLGVDVE